ncbi:MAG TPA: guanylate kinase, partial [Steroidobacteraceae bacterium]
MSARGRLFVISAPSGAGKTSLVRALMAGDPKLAHSVSYTTRKPRPGEVEGKDYHFVSKAEFERMLAADAFLEHAEVFDNRYGTARAQVEGFLAQGRDAILEIDWQGARQVRQAMPACVPVFILPPSRAALEFRLQGRGTDSAEVIARRLRDAVADMGHWAEADFVVVNDDFERALAELRAVIAGQ